MRTRERHIVRGRQGRRSLAALVAGAAALLCLACINEYPDADAPAVRGPSLALMVSFPYIEDSDDAANPVERMHNLRVIITHDTDDDKEEIEYNRFIDFNDTDGRYKYGYLEDPRLIFLVRQEWIGKARNVYLFANSEPIFDRMFKEEANELSGHLDPEEGAYGGNHRKDFGSEITGKYLKAIKDVTFTDAELQEFVKPSSVGTANGIPMSAEYHDVDFKPGNTGIANISVFNSYIVRAANKITFTYINDRMLGDIVVTDWTLQNTAVTSWLLPRVPANDETNKSLFGAGTKYEGDWIAWYSDHIGSGGHAEELNFEVPEGPDVVPQPFSASYDGSAKVTEPREETVTGLCVPQKKISERAPTPVEDKATYYFLESRCISEETGQQQSYFIGFNTLEYNTTPTTDVDEVQHYWNNKRIYPSGAEAYHLDQVKTLLRDTHVKITATFADMGQVNLDVSILNWKARDPVEGQLKLE